MMEAVGERMSLAGGYEYRAGMKRSLFAELAMLGFAMAPAAHGQLMVATFDSTTRIVGDILTLNDRDERRWLRCRADTERTTADGTQ